MSKRWLLGLLTCGALILGSTSSKSEPARYVIDKDHFAIAFSVMHISFSRVIGMFLDGSGSFVFDEESKELSDLKVAIQAPSVFSAHDARDGHIKSGDFLDAENHPEITFVMTGAEATGERTGIISGDLTVRGVTKPADVEVTWNRSGKYPWGKNYVIGISARAVVKRSDFGSTYALEGDIVGDEVAITIELEAIRQ